MGLRLLIADPNDEWLKSASDYFTENLYEVKTVKTGRDAQVAVSGDTKYFSIIMNVNTSRHPAVQVLKFIRSKYPLLKVIMITEIDEGVDKDDAWDEEKLKRLGATEVINKPFSFDDLKRVIEGHQSVSQMMKTVPRREGVSPEVEVDAQDDKFSSVKIEEFYTAAPVLFDLFIKLKSGKYVKILHAGDTFSRERIDKYRNEKNVTHLYFDKKDLFKYVKFTNYFAGKVMGNEKVDTKVKVKMIQNISEKYLEQAFSEGMKPQVIEQGQEICENIYSMIQDHDDLYKVFREYSDFDPNAYTHAYLTTLFSTSIIKQFEWQSQTTIECAAFACMFHDIGKMKLDPTIAKKKKSELTDEEFEEYKKHPEYGVELIDGKPLINNSIKQMIIQHHEHYDGSGYPFGIKREKVLTLANIVCLADHFVHIIQDEDKKPVEALKILLGNPEEVVKFNSLIVENLIKAFVPPDKKKKQNFIPSNSKMVKKAS